MFRMTATAAALATALVAAQPSAAAAHDRDGGLALGILGAAAVGATIAVMAAPPVMAQPVYVAPPPVYAAPAPVYMAPPPVVYAPAYAPAPVYYYPAPGYYYYRR